MSKKKSRSTKTKSKSKEPKVKVIKTRMTKRQLTEYVQEYVESNEAEAVQRLSSSDTKKIVKASLEGLAVAIERSIAPRGAGQFMFPGVLKVWLKERKALKKGTLVRSPATGEMVKSKGRPASKRVKVGPLVRLRRAAAGET